MLKKNAFTPANPLSTKPTRESSRNKVICPARPWVISVIKPAVSLISPIKSVALPSAPDTFPKKLSRTVFISTVKEFSQNEGVAKYCLSSDICLFMLDYHHQLLLHLHQILLIFDQLVRNLQNQVEYNHHF